MNFREIEVYSYWLFIIDLDINLNGNIQEPLNIMQKQFGWNDSSGIVRRRLLVVARSFPPRAMVGVIRPAYFVKYLTELGWKVSVVKAADGKNVPLENSLLNIVPDNCSVSELNHWRAPFLEDWLDWLPALIFWGLKRIVKSEYDLVLATGGPFPNFVGTALVCRLRGIPYVLDYRDPWTSPQPEIGNIRVRMFSKFERKMEKFALKKCAFTVVTTDEQAHSLEKDFPFIKDRVHVIHNGHIFDHVPDPSPQRENPAKIRMLYTGRICAYNPLSELIEALEKLQNRRPDLYHKLEVVCIGKVDPPYGEILRKTQHIKHEGIHSLEECVKMQREADLLLGFRKNSNLVATELFEYVAARRPILSLTPKEGSVDRLFRGVKGFVSVDYRDTDGVVSAMIRLIESILRGEEEIPDSESVVRFSRKKGAERLDELLNACLQKEVEEAKV